MLCSQHIFKWPVELKFEPIFKVAFSDMAILLPLPMEHLPLNCSNPLQRINVLSDPSTKWVNGIPKVIMPNDNWSGKEKFSLLPLRVVFGYTNKGNLIALFKGRSLKL